MPLDPLVVRHFGRRYQRPTAVPIVAGTSVILLGVVAVCVLAGYN